MKNHNYSLKKLTKMKKIGLLVCLLVVTVAAQAQFEKGKWFVNPSITGLDLSYDTGTERASFGLEAKGGAFLIDNLALLVHAGVSWNTEALMSTFIRWVWEAAIIWIKSVFFWELMLM